jgi:hypothetical protein
MQTYLVGIPAFSTRSLALMNTLGVRVTDNDSHLKVVEQSGAGVSQCPWGEGDAVNEHPR